MKKWRFNRTHKKRLIRESIIGFVIIFLLVLNSIVYKKNIIIQNNIDNTPKMHWIYSLMIVWSDWLSEEVVYENIIIKVNAPAWAFPEWTELRIVPITQQTQQQEIKEKLENHSNKITQDSQAISFDISFIWWDENWEEIELEPAEWKTVKISFNYRDNETFINADRDNTREIKIYHLDEVSDENWYKANELEVKEILINKDESKEWELVVNASDFSIYTIVDQIMEENMSDSILDGNINTYLWDNNQLSKFTYDIISISWLDNDICYSFMDRNLWATSSDINSSDSYWYYYQHWNNYWFTLQSAQANHSAVTIDTKQTASNYYNKTFIEDKLWYRYYSNNYLDGNLWWGGDDYNYRSEINPNIYDNYIERQWPCPDGRHVPSTQERINVLKYWNDKYWDINNPLIIDSWGFAYYQVAEYWYDFQQRAKIPNAWSILENLSESGVIWDFWRLWSSSVLAEKNNNSKLILYTFNVWIDFVWISPYINNFYDQGKAVPIRCFYNSTSCDDIPESTILRKNCDLVDYGWWILEHWDSLTVYNTSSVACPDTCTSIITWTITCNDWVLEWDTDFTNTKCISYSISCLELDYPFTTCPTNWICIQSCTEYTSDENYCYTWTTRYQLNGCDNWYHQVDDTCISDIDFMTCDASWTPENAIPVMIDVPITWSNGSRSNPSACTWKCNTWYTQEWNSCKQNCVFNWQSILHWSSVFAYLNLLESCPGECMSEVRTCEDWVLLWSFMNTGCRVYWISCWDSDYPFTTCPLNGICTESCTPYTVDNNSCIAWTVKYQLNGCNSGYHTEDWESCVENIKQIECIQWVRPANSSYILWEVTVTRQWTRNSWNWSMADDCDWACNEHFHTWANNNLCEIDRFQITWKNSDGSILETDTWVVYWTTPSYDWVTPTSGWDLQYSYQFIWWIPEISKVKWNTIYIAKYNPILPNAVSQDEYDKNPLDNLDENNEIETEKNLTWFVSNFFEKWIDLDESQLQIFNEVMHMWDSLNEQEISWQDIYKNIIVSVLAPIWSFPKGTELRIIPIKTKSQIQEIKEQLIENTDVTQESELVSFDISFIYTLSNGEEIELQPYTWQTVKVSFNYTYNDTLSEANSDSNKELKVYHLEEVKDEKGKKTDEVEVKEIEINNEESSDWELVVDVDKFSVYTLAAADGWLRAAAICTVTFQNGECYFWTQEKDGTCGFDMPAPIEVECWWTVSRQDIDEPYYTNTTSKYDETYNYNYYFTRWTTTLDPWYTSTNYNYNFNTPVTEDIILYAIWAYKSSQNWSNNANYTKTVTFNANGWTLTSTGSMLYGMYGLIKQPSDPIRAWYMLNCWSTRQTDTSCSYAYDFNSTTNTVTDDVDLYAQWSSLSYTIRFNANAWNGSINDINASYNNDYQLPSSWFSRNWYDLVWWNTESDWSGTGYDLWEVVRNITTTNGDIVTLYAQWGQMNRVTFEGNGWTVSVSYIDVVSGQVAEAPEEPTWSKHGFLGWYLTGSNSVFNFSTPITSDITLYAHWEELETVTVTFNSNWWSSVEPQEINPWERAVKPTNPTKNNQGFKYWTTDSAWNNEYDFKTPVTDDLILYAQWANICTVTFQNGYCYYNNSTNAQCTFSFTTTSVNVACGTPVERPEDPDSPITVTMGSRYNQQDRNMYFSKWSKTQNPWYNNTSNNYDFSTPVTSNLTLYAIWYVSYFTVTFNANGGMLNWSSSVTVWQYTRNNTVYWWYARRPEDPIRTWYDFKWWSTSNSTNWSEFDFNTTRITADTPLYALWTPITYTIKYNANGWAWNMANTDMTYGTAQNLRTNTFTKTNATFSGWNTKANESWTGYSNGESVNNLTDVAWRTINLYAQWNCNSGYHDDWGECVQDAQDCEFLWQTIADGSGLVVYSTSSPTCPTICTTWIVTCTNGVLWWDTWYTNLTCAPVSTSCDASFTLNSTGANGTYDSCTPYTANDNSCNAWTTVYKLTNCANGFHTEDNSSCTSDTKQVSCIQNWKPEHSSYVAWNVNITWQWTWNNGSRSTADNCAWTCDSHYHTWVNNNSCEIDTFQITWKDGNWATLKTDTVNYNVVPSYSWATPTKTPTAEYTYTFNWNWSPTPVVTTADATYTAQFDTTKNNYTINIVSNNTNSWTVSQSSVNVPYWTNISTNGTMLTIWSNIITANPKTQTAQYDFSFVNWTNPCGNQVTWSCIITANFNSLLKSYTVIWKNSDWTTLETDNYIPYWTMPSYDWATPTSGWNAQYSYIFNWWTPEIIPVVWTATYTAEFSSIINYYTATIIAEPEWYWTVSPTSVTKNYNSTIIINDNQITIWWTTVTATPTARTDEFTYTFSGWENTCGNNWTKLTWDCTITAQFERTTNEYVITFYDRDWWMLWLDVVKFWDIPVYSGTNPVKQSDEDYEYEFIWWSPSILPVTWDMDYMAVYESYTIPHINFVSPTPINNAEITWNRFTTKIEISNADDINNVEYEIDGESFDITLLNYWYNFDNVAELWEITNTRVKSIIGENDGIVHWATRVNSGRYWWAYYFDWIDDYIEFDNMLTVARKYSLEYRVKPDWWEWTHIIKVWWWSNYVNWQEVEEIPQEFWIAANLSNVWVDDEWYYFRWLVDEVKVHWALTPDQVQYLYKSNLRKTGTGTLEFEIINTCLDITWTYTYSIEVQSTHGISTSTWRSMTTNIPWINVEWTWYDFWTYVTTWENLILTWTMWILSVTDYIWKIWWRVYFTTSPALVWEETNQEISTENLKFKANNLIYNPLYEWIENSLVWFWEWISTTQYNTAHWNEENDNILEYIVRETDENDFMCSEVWVYSDNTEIELEVPAWQVEDNYNWTLWITLQQE